jgi:putative lipoic acid-binding regulatory protein
MFENQEIIFPVEWNFRVVCDASVDVADDLLAVLKSFGVNEMPSTANRSSGGKYQSYAIKVLFHDKETMHLMASELGKVNGVKMVL